MFDVKKDKWFVRVANKQEAIAVQEWAFSEGLGWCGSLELRTDFDAWGTDENSKAVGCGHFGGNSLGQAPGTWWESNGHKEIKLTYKFGVDTVIYPEVESPQQKQIKALEETIAQAAAQIQKLKEEM